MAILHIDRARAIFLLFCYHQGTESEWSEIEMRISKPILVHKNKSKALWDNNINNLQDGRKNCVSSLYLWSFSPFSTILGSPRHCVGVTRNGNRWISINIQKKNLSLYRLRILIHYNMGIFWNNFNIFPEMWTQLLLYLSFRSYFLYFLFISLATTGYISAINTGLKYTSWRDLYHKSLFWYTSINLISDWYSCRYELLIAMACYLYTISTHFEERKTLWMEIWLSTSIYISEYNTIDRCDEYYHYKKYIYI